MTDPLETPRRLSRMIDAILYLALCAMIALGWSLS